ncbi:MAG: FeoB-associated Cys-rich membrane protein [Desulfomonilaceae bacterium]
MWQNLVVGLIILLAAIFVVYRFIKNFSSSSSNKPNCACNCAKCCLDSKNCPENTFLKDSKLKTKNNQIE